MRLTSIVLVSLVSVISHIHCFEDGNLNLPGYVARSDYGVFGGLAGRALTKRRCRHSDDIICGNISNFERMLKEKTMEHVVDRFNNVVAICFVLQLKILVVEKPTIVLLGILVAVMMHPKFVVQMIRSVVIVAAVTLTKAIEEGRHVITII